MKEAIRNEVRGLFERRKFKVILKEDYPPDANIWPGRFLLTIKSTGMEK